MPENVVVLLKNDVPLVTLISWSIWFEALWEASNLLTGRFEIFLGLNVLGCNLSRSLLGRKA
jgi:hypothetical protein